MVAAEGGGGTEENLICITGRQSLQADLYPEDCFQAVCLLELSAAFQKR